MKKITALILAAIMLLSLLAACGEKTPAPATENGDTAQASQTGEETAAPAPASDEDEEKDKDATETVTETGEVVITNTEPAPGADAQTQTPQTQTPQTQTPPAQTPQTQTQQPQTAQTSASGVPVSSLASKQDIYLKKPFNKPSDVRVMVWGDSVINVHSIEDTLRQLALCDGFNLNMFYDSNNYSGSVTTYQFSSTFEWDGDETTSNITGWKRNKLKGHITDANKGLDYLVINTGRDRPLTDSVYRAKTLKSLKYIYDLIKKNCPQC